MALLTLDSVQNVSVEAALRHLTLAEMRLALAFSYLRHLTMSVFGSHEVSVSEQPLTKRSLSKSLALVKKKAL